MHFEDDRTDSQRQTHNVLIVGTDSFLSGWGGARGGTSVAAWACQPKHARTVLDWVQSRSDMKRVRVIHENGRENRKYRPRGGCVHFHIYCVTDDHPAMEKAMQGSHP